MPPSRTRSYHPLRYHDPRRDKRMVQPVFDVRIGDEVWRTANWSLGGLLLIRPYEGLLEPDDPVRGSIAFPAARESEGVPLESIPFKARVVRRVRRNRALALRFDPLDERLLTFLERCWQRRLRPAE